MLRGVTAAAPEEWDWNVPAPNEGAVGKRGPGRRRERLAFHSPISAHEEAESCWSDS